MSSPPYRQRVGSQGFVFNDLTALLARATPARSGDVLAGVAAGRGLSYEAAARQLYQLLNAARRRELSGIQLKADAPPSALA